VHTLFPLFQKGGDLQVGVLAGVDLSEEIIGLTVRQDHGDPPLWGPFDLIKGDVLLHHRIFDVFGIPVQSTLDRFVHIYLEQKVHPSLQVQPQMNFLRRQHLRPPLWKGTNKRGDQEKDREGQKKYDQPCSYFDTS